MSPAPQRTAEQRMTALAQGNDIRIRRAALKRKMKRDPLGGIHIALAHLQDPAPWLCTMKVYDLLKAVRGIGRVAANKIIAHTRVSPSKTLEGLTERQRRLLIDELEGIARRRNLGRPFASVPDTANTTDRMRERHAA